MFCPKHLDVFLESLYCFGEMFYCYPLQKAYKGGRDFVFIKKILLCQKSVADIWFEKRVDIMHCVAVFCVFAFLLKRIMWKNE